MNNERFPVIITEIGDVRIRSVLDNGFIRNSELAPEIHAHAFYELLVAVDGRIAIDVQDQRTENKSIVMDAGEVCLIPPGVYHSTRGASDSPVKLAIRFSFDRDMHASSNPESVFNEVKTALSPWVSAQKLSHGSGVFDITCEIRHEISQGGIATKEYLQILLGQLYVRLFRLLYGAIDGAISEVEAVIPTKEEDNRQIQIEEFIFTHLGDQITEDDLADEMHLSKRQLSRVFRQLFGKSFRQMLIEARLNRAAQLLASTDLSVEEIAAQVGYTSLSGFYTAFRGRFALSIGQYRRTFGGKR